MWKKFFILITMSNSSYWINHWISICFWIFFFNLLKKNNDPAGKTNEHNQKRSEANLSLEMNVSVAADDDIEI